MRSCKLNIYQKFIKSLFILIFVGSLGLVCQVLAAEISNFSAYRYLNDPIDSWSRASDSELEKQRGGFLLPNGVMIDISIEKVISLNGIETFSSYFQFPGNNYFLLQNGDGNIMTDSNNSALASVVQNNLDDQIIKTMNTINLEISNLQNINLNDGSRVFTDQIIPHINY